MLKTNILAFRLLAPMLAFPSLYALSALPLAAIPAVLAATTLALYFLLHTNRFTPILTTSWPSLMLITAISLLAPVICQNIPTFIPSSWNTLLTPLSHSGLLPLLTPLTLAFTVFTLRTTGHAWLQTNRVILSLFTCLLMWPDGAADLPALGLMLLNIILLLTRQRIQWTELAALILLLAAASTARAIFIYVPLLVGFSLFAVWPKRALAVTLGSYALMLAFGITLPTITVTSFTAPPTLAALALLTIVFIQSIYHWRWWPAPQHAAWLLGAPLFMVALHNLSQTSSLAAWYGAIYLTPALPVITYTLLRPTFKHR